MANFVPVAEAIIVQIISWPSITTSTMQILTCTGGEVIGFQIYEITLGGITYQMSAIYNYSNGAGVQVGTVSVTPGIDLTGGLFSSGVFCNGDPLTPGTKFFLVDY